MTTVKQLLSFKEKYSKRIISFVEIVVLALAAFMPFYSSARVSAAPQLTNRKMDITTAKVSTNFDTTFTFRIPASPAAAVQGIQIEYCTTPIGTCVATAGTNVPTLPATAGSTVSQSNWVGGGVAFGTYTRMNGSTSGTTNNQMQVIRTDASNVTSTATDLTLGFTGLTNTATANQTYYARIRMYNSNATFNGTTIVWEGVVAQSTSQTLTINARVQETLTFCVGSSTVDDATTSLGADCTAVTGTSIDLGIVNASSISVSPVVTGNGGDNKNAVAMVRTNAYNGVVIDYKALQDTSSGKLKVTGATCSGVSTTDQCFNSQGGTQGTLTAGTENFGMTIAGINCGSTTAYTCTFSAGTYNLVRDTNYDGVGSNTYTVGSTNGFAWDDTGTADRIASSAASAVKVVDDEALILKFAATSSITTPTGTYQTQADFIATPTF